MYIIHLELKRKILTELDEISKIKKNIIVDFWPLTI